MRKILMNEICNKAHFFGRCFMDSEKQVMYMNWTCSGVEFVFRGTNFKAEFYAKSEEERDGMMFDENASVRTIWPWIGVFIDDQEIPLKTIELNQEQWSYTLFESEKEETHKIKIVKLSENAKGKAGLFSFITDGSITEPEESKYKYKLEFVGDSITCGFGNETLEMDKFFYSEDENGWMSHAAIAARILNAEYNVIAVSGITVGDGIKSLPFIPPFPAMEQLYNYTDRCYEDSKGTTKDYTQWDFSSYQPDAIVLNLGTNDSTQIKMGGDFEKGEAKFEENYKNFIYQIREKNGGNSLIVCTLGTLDYYLYDNILRAVETYKTETKDEKIKCLKYGGIIMGEGFGACAHPSKATQIRMGEELAEKLKEWLGN